MKKRLLFLSSLFMFSVSIIGQVTDEEKNLRTANNDTIDGWKKGGLFSLNLSQASFSDWAGGGQNSINVNSSLYLFANLKKNKNRWDNMLNVGYGIFRQGDKGKFIKSDDKIELNSKYGRNASKDWYYAALLNFKTQMAPGYNYPNDSNIISNFLAPAYIIAAIGMDYKPNDNFSAFIAPLTSKSTIVNVQDLADAGAFGVTKASYDTSGNVIKHGEKYRSEFGGYIRLVYKSTLFKDKSVTILSNMDLFSNYLHNPQNIDVNWETIIGLKVNKFISATISTTLVYDDDIKLPVDGNGDGVKESFGPRLQLKEILAVGFSYKF
ncbi:MAG: DUF3078 domain-containing protein [Bacteroidota bacterium]|nr:DUF3078 domain-containing protein [Bacteroidota bacterium]